MSSFIQIALAANAENARRVLQTFSCESSLNVGDPVYIDPTTANKVLKPGDNLGAEQIIGLVFQKPSPESARVIMLGVTPGFSGLTICGRVFLSTAGAVTQTKPTNNGYLQRVGIAVSETENLVFPDNVKVKMTA